MKQILNNAAILGAGLGSRLQSITPSKPLLKIEGRTLLERLLSQLQEFGFSSLRCALRDELLSSGDKAALPRDGQYLFVNTESSLHTLGEVVQAEKKMLAAKEALFVTMADTILRPQDFQAFIQFCRDLTLGESAILATPYVRDEKPLVVETNKDGIVTRFGSELREDSLVTSGMYCLSAQALHAVEPCLASGMHKMRNFLSHLVEKNQKIRVFVVEKTIDVDHPEDLQDALRFIDEARV